MTKQRLPGEGVAPTEAAKATVEDSDMVLGWWEGIAAEP
jgi:hypothetical protein